MAKRKITVTIDDSVLTAMELLGVENLSATVNAALVAELETLGHRASLGELLAQWDSAHGPVSEADRNAAAAAFAELDGVPSGQVA
jgi:Arc/MetJ family transcription regulator